MDGINSKDWIGCSGEGKEDLIFSLKNTSWILSIDWRDLTQGGAIGTLGGQGCNNTRDLDIWGQLSKGYGNHKKDELLRLVETFEGVELWGWLIKPRLVLEPS